MLDQQITKIYFKTIIQGRLEFGSAKSYDKLIKLYDSRAETYHKNDVVFTSEEIFDPEKLTMEIPRYVGQITEKRYKNTIALLSYSVQFAVTGSIRAWMSEEGKVMHYNLMEPESDKAAVRSFLKGRSLVKEDGKEEEAIAALSKAIEKYDRHAQAYERRAKVVFRMQNYHDAKRDYTKCINLDSTIPTAYYGRAKVHMIEESWKLAIDDFNQALKRSVALQPVYWKSRRHKATCHMKLKQSKEALFDLKLYSNRNFSKEDVNYNYKGWSLLNYAKLLEESEEYKDAIANLDKALLIVDDNQRGVNAGEILRQRSIIKKKAGKSGHVKDLKAAAEAGDKIAKKMLGK